MKRNNHYTLVRLHGVSYLIPWGQARADFGNSLELNEVGEQIWEELEDHITLKELVQRILARNGLGEESFEEVEEDVGQFIAALRDQGVVEEGYEELYFVGGIYVRLVMDQRMLVPDLDAFRVESIPEGQICYTFHLVSHLIPAFDREIMVLKHGEMDVYSGEEGYRICFGRNRFLKEGYISRDGRSGRLCFDSGLGQALLAEEIYFGLRLLVLYAAQTLGGFTLHSASILYRGRAWLFSGPSGMGKSTHTGMWQKELGVNMINGDLNMLVAGEDGIQVKGMPWCGTSGIYSREAFPLGGIVILHRGEENRVEEKSPDKKQLAVYQRLISPFWSREMVEAQLAFAGQVTDCVPVWHLYCTKDISAVYCIKDYIDQCLGELDG